MGMTRPKVMGRVSIGDQEKCGAHAMAVENGKRRLKLAPKAIIESERNYRLHGSTILTALARYRAPILRPKLWMARQRVKKRTPT